MEFKVYLESCIYVTSYHVLLYWNSIAEGASMHASRKLEVKLNTVTSITDK
jgi:hypothetical protein